MLKLPENLSLNQKIALLNYYPTFPSSLQIQIHMKLEEWITEWIEKNHRPIRLSVLSPISASVNPKKCSFVAWDQVDIQREYLDIQLEIRQYIIEGVKGRVSVNRRGIQDKAIEYFKGILDSPIYEESSMVLFYDGLSRLCYRYKDILDTRFYDFILSKFLVFKLDAYGLLNAICNNLVAENETMFTYKCNYHSLLLSWIMNMIHANVGKDFSMERFEDICLASYIFLTEMHSVMGQDNDYDPWLFEQLFPDHMRDLFKKNLLGYYNNPSDYLVRLENLQANDFQLDFVDLVKETEAKKMRTLEKTDFTSAECRDNLVFGPFELSPESLPGFIRGCNQIDNDFLANCDLPEGLYAKAVSFTIPEQELLFLKENPWVKLGFINSKGNVRYLVSCKDNIFMIFKDTMSDTGKIYGIGITDSDDKRPFISIPLGKKDCYYQLLFGKEV